MVKIPKRGSDPFLKPEHVEDGDLALIIKEPFILSAEKTKFGKERTILIVQIKRTGSVYQWGLNTTSNDRLVEKFGGEGDLWKGKEVRVQKRSENVRGQEKFVLYASPSVQATITST